MSNSRDGATGGARITPSARPSIHNYRHAQSFEGGDIMGRYDTKGFSSSRTVPPQAVDKGRDVVDNVQSKFSRAVSPPKQITQKRNSVDLPFSPIYAEDSDGIQEFAKSLPASLPSHSNYSDEFGRWSNEASPNVSYELPRYENVQHSIERSDFEGSNYESLPTTPERSLNDTEPRHQEQNKSQTSKYIGLFSALIAIAFAICYANVSEEIISEVFKKNKYNLVNFTNDLNFLKEKYKIRGNSILQIQAGISTIFEREDTGSFVLAYQSDKENFDPDEYENLINTIASTAVRYLRNDTAEVHHIVVDGSTLEMRTHKELIDKYKDDVTKTGVMLVRELDEVPSTLAMAFHYYCDEYNPLVKKSAIFFTLDMTKCSHTPVEPTHAQIEKCLHRKWSGMPKDNINPLLNRVVNTVVDITGD